jgi:hypothetical protein
MNNSIVFNARKANFHRGGGWLAMNSALMKKNYGGGVGGQLTLRIFEKM